MLSLNQNEKVTCEYYGAQTTKLNLARHKEERFSSNTVLYPLSQLLHKSQNHKNYHIAKKNSALKLDVTFKCKLCNQEFRGFHA